MSSHETASIDLPAIMPSIEVVQDTVETWWTALGDETIATRFALETAIVEIAANIVEHSRSTNEGEGRRFTLELSASDEELTAIFTDNGRPADVDLSAVTMAGLEEESGRGLALAIASLDRLEHRHEGGHNIWTLVCRR